MGNEDGRSPSGPCLRPFGAEPQDASQAEPLVPNATAVRRVGCAVCNADYALYEMGGEYVCSPGCGYALGSARG
jgi:hypothetical protein